MNRKIIFFVISFFISVEAFSQVDSVKNEKIYSWYYSCHDRSNSVIVDTLLTNFQNFNSLYDNNIRDSYLGNLGSARNSHIFTERNRNDLFLFNGPFRNYFHTSKNTKYYNTKRPFTNLRYSSGGPKKIAEQTLGVLHTQNVNENFNVGFNYNLISSVGSYANQKVVGNFITFFTSYRKDAYSVHANFNINNITQNENGGVDSLSLLDDNFDSENIPVRLDEGAYSEIHNKSFQLINKYSLFRKNDSQADSNLTNINDSIKSKDSILSDSVRTINKVEKNKRKIQIDIFHELNYIENYRKYYDDDISESFYADLEIFIDSNETADKISSKKFSNKFGLSTQVGNSAKLNLFLANEIVKHKYNTPNDSIFSVDDTIVNNSEIHKDNNNYFEGDIGTSFKDFEFVANLKYYFSGYKKGDIFLASRISKEIGQSIFKVNLKFSDLEPNYFYSNYSSNHYQWNSKLKRSYKSFLNLSYLNNNWNFAISADLTRIKNFIYFDNSSCINQDSSSIEILSLKLKKNFNLWNFHFNNKIIFQKSSKESVINLPQFSSYHSFYYQHNFSFSSTGGKLLAQIGVDLNYFSNYFAQKYNPVSGVFVNQADYKIGEYPVADVFINLKVKSVRFFLKYSHVNYNLVNGYYLGSPDYPIPPRMFKFGLSWVFYN